MFSPYLVVVLCTALPTALAAWTCVCGKSEEGESRVLNRVFRNFSECLSGEFASRVYVPFYNLGEGGTINWWIDVRHKQSVSGGFYLRYELVHERYDPLNRYSDFQVFDVLNYSDHVRAFGEMLFDVNWRFLSTIDFERRELIDDKEQLNAAKSRLNIIACENKIYERSVRILNLEKDREYWLKKIRERQKEDQELMLKLYENCLRNHSSLIPNYQKGVLDFFSGNFLNAFNHMQEFIRILLEQRIRPVIDSAALLCGIIAAEVKEYALSESCLSHFLRENPDHKEAYLERAVTRLALNDLGGALEDFLLSGLHTFLLEIRPQLEIEIKLVDGIVTGFDDYVEMDEGDAVVLRNSLTDFVDTRIKRSKPGVQSSLILLSSIIVCVENIIDKNTNISDEIIVPEMIFLIQNYDILDSFEKGRCIGIMIRKYGIGAFSMISGLQSVEFYRAVKKLPSLLGLAEMLEQKGIDNEK